MHDVLKCECPPGSESYEHDEGANLSFMWRLDRRFGVSMMSVKILLEKVDLYTDCNRCHSPPLCYYCKCLYCGKRDDCECALFDTVTGG